MTTRTIGIHDSVAVGRYPDENEVVRAALQLLERAKRGLGNFMNGRGKEV